MGTGIIAIVIAVGLVVFFATVYNSLVRLNVRVEEAWSDITVQLKRRYDLIPNLINSVKGYATHESTVFEELTAARVSALSTTSVKDTAQAENQFEQTLKSLFAVAEAYPDLKASQNYVQLQAELADTENKIQAARRFYNGAVRDFNTKRTVFPTNMFASILNFKSDKEFFELDEAAMATASRPVEVKL